MTTVNVRSSTTTRPSGLRRLCAGIGLSVAVLLVGMACTGSSASAAPTSSSHHSGKQGSTTKWDAIVAGEWVVPSVNLESYEVGADSAAHLPQAFENWYTFTCVNGQYEGLTQSVIQFYIPSPLPGGTGTWSKPVYGPLSTMAGSISPSGVISMTIVPGNTLPTSYAKGHMIFISGQWRMTMQTQLPLTEGQTTATPYILQWANMTKTTTIPGAPDFTTLGDMTNMTQSADPLDSPQYSWLAGTNWTERDTQFEGGRSEPFAISSYSNGYFFGASTGSDKFWVSGSVAPDGSTFLVFTLADKSMFVRSGSLQGKSHGAHMRFSSFYGTPAYGDATQVHAHR